MRGPTALLLVLLLARCGSSQTRPVLLETEPAIFAVLDQPVFLIKLKYDVPVTILSHAQLNVTRDGIGVPMDVWIDVNDPTLVMSRSSAGPPLGPGFIAVAVAPGLVVNDQQHYALDEYRFAFTVNPAAKPGSDPTSLLPPDAEVVAIRPQATSDAQRLWVQLADGGGNGEALVALDPHDGRLTPVRLTCSPNGDLLSPAPALAVTPDGRVVYVACHDVAEGRVRVCRVDGASATETDTRLLSAPASPTTRPHALRLVDGGARVRVECETPWGRQVVDLDASTLQELPPAGS